MTSLRHPWCAPRLSAAEAGWGRCALVVVIALVLPALVSGLIVFAWAPTFAGPPKDGSVFTFGDHLAMFLGLLTASVVVSWMMAPVALVVLRLAAMTGWAGWGSAAVAALTVGLPATHVILNGDITTENMFLLPHLGAALAVLGLSVWALFWGFVSFRRKRNRTKAG